MDVSLHVYHQNNVCDMQLNKNKTIIIENGLDVLINLRLRP
jgi:hypothetical protein